jgi:hypothetical protein
MPFDTIETRTGARYDIIQRDRVRTGLLSWEWMLFVVPQGTQTVLGLRLRYRLSLGCGHGDDIERDIALVRHALENEADKVTALSKSASGFVIDCRQEPYRSLSVPFCRQRPESKSKRCGARRSAPLSFSAQRGKPL